MTILNSTIEDLDTIFDLYEKAIAYQKKMSHRHWLGFDKAMVEMEIREGRQWKIIEDGKIACIFMITWNDPGIWKERDSTPAIYLHRIVTHPDFRGQSYVKAIVEWAHQYGKAQGKQFIRLDTFGDNKKLVDYYIACGFTLLGMTAMGKRADLPAHYAGANLGLFEIAIA